MDHNTVGPGPVIKPKDTRALMTERATAILQVIMENYSNPQFNVGALAEKTGKSTSFLRDVIYSVYSMAPQELLETVRLKKAVQLLSGNNEKIDRVCRQAGYAYSKTFRRAFLNRVGMTPAECRDRLMYAIDKQSEIERLLAKLWCETNPTHC